VNPEFGVYVNRFGVPLLDRGIVEWECQAERVSYRYPYVLLFCSAFVEIRNLITGRLVQIFRPDAATRLGDIGGDEDAPQTLRCLWDGRSGTRNFDYDPELGEGEDGRGYSSELPAMLGAVDLAMPSRSSITTQQCVFALSAPIPPPRSPGVAGYPVRR